MKILFISPWFPTPMTNGSKVRIYHLLKALSNRHRVDLISFTRDNEIINLHAGEHVVVHMKGRKATKVDIVAKKKKAKKNK